MTLLSLQEIVSSRAQRGISGSGDFKQICPRWIERFDQSILLRAAPSFDLLFAGDRVFDVFVLLGIDQGVDPIFSGERTAFSAAMLGDSILEIVRHADIHGVPPDVGQDVNVVRVHSWLEIPRCARDDTISCNNYLVTPTTDLCSSAWSRG